MSLMTAYASRFEVLRDTEKCISCGRCIQECAHGVHQFYKDTKKLTADEKRCVNCYRCVATCPTQALKIILAQHVQPAFSRFVHYSAFIGKAKDFTIFRERFLLAFAPVRAMLWM